jgi:hypothetical protein
MTIGRVYWVTGLEKSDVASVTAKRKTKLGTNRWVKLLFGVGAALARKTNRGYVVSRG